MDNQNIISNQPMGNGDGQVGEIDFRLLLGILRSRLWVLIACAFVGAIIGFLATLNVVPQYNATSLVQVNESESSSSVLSGLSMFSGNVAQANPSAVQQALIHSRFILEPVIKALGLNVKVSAHYFPFFGRSIARQYNGKDIATPWLGLSKYAWGGETIRVSVFNVDAPVFDHHAFTLIARKNSHFDLYGPSKQFILSGQVGILAVSKRYPNTSILVNELKSRVGERFTVAMAAMPQVVKNLSGALTIKDLGSLNAKASSADTGVLQLSINWPDKVELPIILNKIIQMSVNKNVLEKSRDAQQQLQFIQQQVPLLKKSLEQSELALNNYRAQRGIIDMSTEAHMLVQQSAKAQAGLEKLRMLKAQLLQSFTSRYPLVRSTDDRIVAAKNIILKLNKRIKLLPHADQKAMSLMRDAKVKENLYAGLLQKVQQLKVVKAGTVGDVQVLNQSTVPLFPLPVHNHFVVLAGGVAGIILAALVLLVNSLLFQGASDPEEIEERLGIPVQAVIPFSRKQELLNKKAQKFKGKEFDVLALSESKDPSIESLRSLRTSIQLTSNVKEKNTISIMGTSPSVGKSFVSLNFSQVLADSGKRVLLIDADLRKGKLHRHYGNRRVPGLAAYLSDKADKNAIIKPIHSGLDFIPCGKYPSNPSELFMRDKFKYLLDEVSAEYDFILVDTPPIMAVTDALIIGQHTDLNLLLVGLGKNQMSEIKIAVKRLGKSNVKVNGIVCNYFSKSIQYYSANSYNYYYYSYK